MMIIIPTMTIVRILIATGRIILVRSIGWDFICGIRISFGIHFLIMDSITITVDITPDIMGVITLTTIGAPDMEDL